MKVESLPSSGISPQKVKLMEAAQSSSSTGKEAEANPVSDARINVELTKTLHTGAAIFAGLTALLGLVSLGGWLITKEATLFPSGVAVEFLIWACAYFVFQKSDVKVFRFIAYALVRIVTVTAVLNIATTVFDIDVGLLTRPLVSIGDSPLNFPGPILPGLATSFLILSVATSMMFKKSARLTNFYKILGIVLLLPNLVIIGTSMVGLQSICTYFGCIKPSLFASTAFLLSGLAVIFTHADEGVTAPFTYNTAGGRLMRSIILTLLPSIPIFALVTLGQDQGFYDRSIGYGIMILTLVSLFVCGIAWGVKKVEVIEAEKTVALALLQESIESFVPESDTTYKMVCLECAREFDDASIFICPVDGSELGKLADKLKIGSVFADSYEINKFIGSGGCSIIYEAKHILMKKQVALKLLRSNFATEIKYVQRFQRESKATSQLMHPNIVAVHDFGISLAGQPYIVMDFLKGISLGDRIERAGALPWKQAVPIVVDICEGLQYAHRNGVLHRDLKPANIMLVDEGTGIPSVKIVDFGLAKTSDAGDLQLTGTGELIGSPTYMSPEQCKGESVDNRTDVYSLGALIYHTLCGYPAVETGNIYEAMRIQIAERPKPFPESLGIPGWLSNIVFKALEKDPTLRQQSIDEILTELRANSIAPTILEYK